MGISLASLGESWKLGAHVDFNHQMETNQDPRVWDMFSMKRVYGAQQLVANEAILDSSFIIHSDTNLGMGQYL